MMTQSDPAVAAPADLKGFADALHYQAAIHQVSLCPLVDNSVCVRYTYETPPKLWSHLQQCSQT
jgi:hypothetical protein